MEFKIFTDGSSTDQAKTVKNKELRKGGIGIYHPDSKTKIYEKFPFPNSTNNKAEYWACIRALEWVLEQTNHLDEKEQKQVNVSLYTDSMLLINSMTKWIKGWKRKNWKKSDGRPVLNQDLIMKLDNLITNKLPLTTFVKVKAHQKKPIDESKQWLWEGNYIADELANKGRFI